MELKQFKIKVYPLRNRLLHYAQKLVENNSDAEDAVQEVLLKLWGMRQQLDEYQNIEALIFKVAHNVCIDLIRKRHFENVDLEEIQFICEKKTPEEALIETEQIKIIEQIVEQLPSLQKNILRMKDIEGYETEEIAEITGCNAEAIRSNLSRARKKVRDTYLFITNQRRRA